jgi:hypothetical protein
MTTAPPAPVYFVIVAVWFGAVPTIEYVNPPSLAACADGIDTKTPVNSDSTRQTAMKSDRVFFMFPPVPIFDNRTMIPLPMKISNALRRFAREPLKCLPELTTPQRRVFRGRLGEKQMLENMPFLAISRGLP